MCYYERIDARGAWETGRPVSFSPKGALTHHLQTGGGIPPFGRARALFTNCLSDSSPEGAGNAADRNFLCSRLYILRYQQNDEVAYCPPSRRLPA